MQQKIVLGAILLTGFILRVAYLDKQSLWLDEMTSILVSHAPFMDIIQGRVFDNFTPPLYYALLKMWGFLIPLDETGLRLFSAVIDSCNILFFWLLARQLYTPYRCLLAVAAYAFSPFMLYYAQEGRMYSLQVFWVLAYSLVFLKMLADKTGVFKWAALSGIILALGVYTHYYFAFFAIGVNVLGMILCRRSRVHIAGIVLAGLLGLTLFFPWMHIVSRLAQSGGQSFRGEFILLVLPYAIFRFIVGYAVFPLNLGTKVDYVKEISRNAFYILAVYSVVILMMKDAVLCKEPAGRKMVASLAWIGLAPAIIAVLISVKSPMLSERYLIVSMPFFILLLFSHVRVTGSRVVLILLFSLLGWGNINYFFSPHFGKAQWRDAARFVADRAVNSDLILVEPSYSIDLFKYYLRKSRNEEKLLNNLNSAGRMKETGFPGNLDNYEKVILVSSGYIIGKGIETELGRHRALIDKKIFSLETGIVVSFWGKQGGMIK